MKKNDDCTVSLNSPNYAYFVFQWLAAPALRGFATPAASRLGRRLLPAHY
jgi:hypothetical protein